VSAPPLTWKQAIGWRMRAHRLDRRVPREEAVAVAGELCGLHAQVMSSAELTVPKAAEVGPRRRRARGRAPAGVPGRRAGTDLEGL